MHLISFAMQILGNRRIPCILNKNERVYRISCAYLIKVKAYAVGMAAASSVFVASRIAGNHGSWQKIITSHNPEKY